VLILYYLRYERIRFLQYHYLSVIALNFTGIVSGLSSVIAL
jgi:hypothetical protein